MDLDDRFDALNRSETPDQWFDIATRTPGRNVPETMPKPLRYAGVAALSLLVVAGIVLPLKVLVPLGDHDKPLGPAGTADQSGSPVGVPDVGVITCDKGTPGVETPSVQAHVDGVHLLIPSDDRRMEVRLHPLLEIPGFDPGSDDQVWSEDNAVDPNAWVVNLPPGDYLAICDPDSSVTSHEVMSGKALSAPLTIVDPQGFYAPFADLACPDPEAFYTGVPFPELNPLENADAVLRRALVGIQAADEIVRAGYGIDSTARGWQLLSWQVVRGDRRMVATVTAHSAADETGETLSFEYQACSGSGIGSAANDPGVAHGVGNPDAPLATPYEVPGYTRCDPYDGATCVPVWVTWARLGTLSDQPEVQKGLPDGSGNLPWCPSDSPRGCTFDPDLQPMILFMPAADAERWFQAEGCGRSYDAICSGVSGKPADEA